MSTIPFIARAPFARFEQLEVHLEPAQRSVWLRMRPAPRPCFTMSLLGELRAYQRVLERGGGALPFQGESMAIDYQVLTSATPGVFNLGGDLERFLQCIESRDERWLRQYAKACIDVLYPNVIAYGLPLTTISLVAGDALGGGFEAALSSRLVVAERQAQFGLPEILFNLFPGMGAYQLLSQRLSPAQAERMILSGRMYSAEELYDMGVVDVLAEPGEGVAAVNALIRSLDGRRHGTVALHRVRQRARPVDYDELMDICDIWVETALGIGERDRRMMARLVRSQQRMVEEAGGGEPAAIAEDRGGRLG